MVALNEDLNLAMLKGLLFGWVVLCQHLRWGILLKKIFPVCDIVTWLSLITLKKKIGSEYPSFSYLQYRHSLLG